jgi:hypothetical protein
MSQPLYIQMLQVLYNRAVARNQMLAEQATRDIERRRALADALEHRGAYFLLNRRDAIKEAIAYLRGDQGDEK